ncbi:MAG: hypothetical protein JW751_29400 [Polyangiaceae bacterium]|nr:hypothetical protein [Polyangiaceae bacterium]
MIQANVRVHLAFGADAAELEIETPLGVNPSEAVAGLLPSIGVKPLRGFTVRVGRYLTTHIGLTESDGTGLSPQRAGEVVDAVRYSLGVNRYPAASQTS